MPGPGRRAYRALVASEALLASWNDTVARRAITEFVQAVSGDGEGFVPAAERLAVFDNDVEFTDAAGVVPR
jgi:hypothetical protein